VPQVTSARQPSPAPREFRESCLTPLESSPAQIRAAALTQLRLENPCCNRVRRKIKVILANYLKVVPSARSCIVGCTQELQIKIWPYLRRYKCTLMFTFIAKYNEN